MGDIPLCDECGLEDAVISTEEAMQDDEGDLFFQQVSLCEGCALDMGISFHDEPADVPPGDWRAW